MGQELARPTEQNTNTHQEKVDEKRGKNVRHVVGSFPQRGRRKEEDKQYVAALKRGLGLIL